MYDLLCAIRDKYTLTEVANCNIVYANLFDKLGGFRLVATRNAH